MNIDLPFIQIRLQGEKSKQRSFFNQLFFKLPQQDLTKCTPKIFVDLKFETLNHHLDYCLENKSGLTKDGEFVFLDTKKKQASLNLNSLNLSGFKLIVNPDFDLYYLFTFLIEPLMIILATKHEITFLHASAMARNMKAVIFAAWRHTGKTQKILNLSKESQSSFMADDYVIVYQDTVFSYPKTINLFSYNLRENPVYFKFLPMATTWRLKVVMTMKNMLSKVSDFLPGSLGKIFFRLCELAEVATNVRVSPHQIGMRTTAQASLSDIKLIQATTDGFTEVRFDQSQTATKLTQIIMYELSDFVNLYRQYLFLAPQKQQQLISNFETNYRQLVGTLLNQSK